MKKDLKTIKKLVRKTAAVKAKGSLDNLNL